MRRVALLLFVVALLSAGCVRSVTRRVVPPESAAALDRGSPWLKVHLRDGRALVLERWQVDPASTRVTGEGAALDLDRRLVSSGHWSVPFDSVALFETNVTRLHPSVAALAVIGGVSLAVTVYCIVNPKACFGSCPTFYAWDGEREALQAEGFSGSVSPCLEATDLDALPRARARDGELRVTVRNEALETQVLRRVSLLAVPRPPGGRVYAGADGTFRAGDPPRPPLAAAAPEGDRAAALAALDGVERTSPADSSDLGARETIELAFAPAGPGPLGLVVAARQSLLSTYLFYQALAWMGRGAGEWLAALERGDEGTRARARRADRLVGDIEIEVAGPGGWIPAGRYGELGPIATDAQLVPLPATGPGPVRVRLSLVKGAWRIDQVGLVRLGAVVEPVRIGPWRAARAERDDPGALAALGGQGPPLVTFPGDALELRFRLPAGMSEPELFLESRGYYLEWMREEWRSEEDPGRLAQLFLDPGGALRRMAPEYKRQEAGMDAAFWRSRYAHP